MDKPSVLKDKTAYDGVYCTGTAIAASIAAQHEAVAVMCQMLPKDKWELAFRAEGLHDEAAKFDPAAHPRSDQSKWSFFPAMRYDTLISLLTHLVVLVREWRATHDPRYNPIHAPTFGLQSRVNLGLPAVIARPAAGRRFSPVVIGLGVGAVLVAAYLFWKAE